MSEPTSGEAVINSGAPTPATGSYGSVNTVANFMNAIGNDMSGLNFVSNWTNAFFANMKLVGGRLTTTTPFHHVLLPPPASDCPQEPVDLYVVYDQYVVVRVVPPETGQRRPSQEVVEYSDEVGWWPPAWDKVQTWREGHGRKTRLRFGGRATFRVHVNRARATDGWYHVVELLVTTADNSWNALLRELEFYAIATASQARGSEKIGGYTIKLSARQSPALPCFGRGEQVSEVTVWGNGEVSNVFGPIFEGQEGALRTPLPADPRGMRPTRDAFVADIAQVEKDNAATRLMAEYFEPYFNAVKAEIARISAAKRYERSTADVDNFYDELAEAVASRQGAVISDQGSGVRWLLLRARKTYFLDLADKRGRDVAESTVEELVRRAGSDESICGALRIGDGDELSERSTYLSDGYGDDDDGKGKDKLVEGAAVSTEGRAADGQRPPRRMPNISPWTGTTRSQPDDPGTSASSHLRSDYQGLRQRTAAGKIDTDSSTGGSTDTSRPTPVNRSRDSDQDTDRGTDIENANHEKGF
jgi:hypothetical protein